MGVMYTFPKFSENPPTAVGVGACPAEERQNSDVGDNEGDYIGFFVETVTQQVTRARKLRRWPAVAKQQPKIFYGRRLWRSIVHLTDVSFLPIPWT